jgi:hypothetical protein
MIICARPVASTRPKRDLGHFFCLSHDVSDKLRHVAGGQSSAPVAVRRGGQEVRLRRVARWRLSGSNAILVAPPKARTDRVYDVCFGTGGLRSIFHMSAHDWPRLPWKEVVEQIAPLVFRVYVDQYVGTAFVVGRGRGKPPYEYVALLATARHVVDPATTGFIDTLTLVSSDLERRYASSENLMKIQSLGDEAYDTSVI